MIGDLCDLIRLLDARGWHYADKKANEIPYYHTLELANTRQSGGLSSSKRGGSHDNRRHDPDVHV